MKTYYEILKELREDKNLSQEDMGKILNINQRTVSQYERGIRQIPIELLIKYAEFFGVTTDYILGVGENKRLYLTAARSKDNKPKEWREIDVEKIKNAPETDEDL